MHDYKEIEAVICGFPITPETGLKGREAFEDIAYEIVNHKLYAPESIAAMDAMDAPKS